MSWWQLLELCRSCLSNHNVPASWMQPSCHILKTLSHWRHPDPLGHTVYPPWLLEYPLCLKCKSCLADMPIEVGHPGPLIICISTSYGCLFSIYLCTEQLPQWGVRTTLTCGFKAKYSEYNQKLDWFGIMAVVGSPVGFMTSSAIGTWLKSKIWAWIHSFWADYKRAVGYSTHTRWKRWYGWHHWRCLTRPVTVTVGFQDRQDCCWHSSFWYYENQGSSSSISTSPCPKVCGVFSNKV